MFNQHPGGRPSTRSRLLYAPATTTTTCANEPRNAVCVSMITTQRSRVEYGSKKLAHPKSRGSAHVHRWNMELIKHLIRTHTLRAKCVSSSRSLRVPRARASQKYHKDPNKFAYCVRATDGHHIVIAALALCAVHTNPNRHSHTQRADTETGTRGSATRPRSRHALRACARAPSKQISHTYTRRTRARSCAQIVAAAAAPCVSYETDITLWAATRARVNRERMGMLMLCVRSRSAEFRYNLFV